jgi:hypothetical protein
VSPRKAKTMLMASLIRTLELSLTVAHVNKYVNTHMADFAMHCP